MSLLDRVLNVAIDDSGTFKYILLRVRDGEKEKFVVRGDGGAEYHANVNESFEAELAAISTHLTSSCLGGGRIRHTPLSSELFIYGHSIGFGRADHAVTVELLQKQFPLYRVSYSNDGY